MVGVTQRREPVDLTGTIIMLYGQIQRHLLSSDVGLLPSSPW